MLDHAAGMQNAHLALVAIYEKHAKAFPVDAVLLPACCHIADPASGIKLAGMQHGRATRCSRSPFTCLLNALHCVTL